MGVICDLAMGTHRRWVGWWLVAEVAIFLRFPTASAQNLPPAEAPNSSSSASSAPTPAVTAPVVASRVDAVYPDAARKVGLSGTVLVRVTVTAEGRVSGAEAEPGADALLIEAALDAVRQWTFLPATRGGVAVAARIVVPFEFTAPESAVPPTAGDVTVGSVGDGPALASSPAQPGPAAPVAAPTATPLAPAVSETSGEVVNPAPTAAPATTEVVVKGKRDATHALRSSSDYHMHRDVLEAAPRAEGAEVLRTTPGLYLARPEGGAVAHRYVLRGFDSDHGQDIEFKLDGIPLNLPAHIHGQGYADMGFLIAETVDELRVTEGVHDPRQGDFAVAGTIDVGLAVHKRGVQLKGGIGSFGTQRALGLWAPSGELPDTFGAVQFDNTRGFGQNRRGASANAVVQQGISAGNFRFAAVGILHAARAQLAGVLRKQDVDAGRVGFYDVYPEPTAEAQSALNQRVILGLRGNYVGPDGDTGALGVWLGVDNFRLRENYTGFLQQSQTLSGVTGRGDLIEQRNFTRSLGVFGRYRRAPFQLPGNSELTLELGASGRIDEVEQAQNLIDGAVRGQTWDRRIDAGIRGLDLGGYVDLDLHLAERFRVRVGLRADALAYDVDDRLGNFAPLTRAQDQYLVGFRRSAYGTALGPRASADFDVIGGLTLHAAYGEGYRSPQARTLEDGEQAPFTKVRSVDLGLRYSVEGLGALSVSAYQTDLSDDIAFEAEEGRMERVGKTRRRGAVAELQLRPLPDVVIAASCTYVDAQLLEPPPPTPENPNPPFERGQNLPFVPPLVVRADVGAAHALIAEAIGRIGVGFSALSARPLPYGDYSAPVALLDGSLGVDWRMLGLSLEVFNLLDTRYSALELAFPSQWDAEAPRSRLPARHSIAGSPRAAMLTLEVKL
jgi:iron complex outermembrane recepter protein